MKKTILMAALILVCAGFAFAQTGTIRDIAGLVEIKPAGAQTFVPAKAGDILTTDTVISTGFRSTALIAAGSSLITVRPLTCLSLAELSATADSETINVNLRSGRVRVGVNPPAGTRTNMTVRGPSATASVRGTAFDFDTRNISVRHGVVAFQGSKGAVMLVGEGSASRVESGGKAADPVEVAARSLVPSGPSAVPTGISSASTPPVELNPTTADINLSLEYE